MELFLLFVTLLALTTLLGHILHIHRIQWLTEGSLALLVGLAAGGSLLLYYEHWQGRHIPKDLLPFDTDVFFNVLLPPIIFNAGFSVKKKLFFQNFLTLVLFGVFGTFLTAAGIAVGSYYTLDAVNVGEHNLLAAALALGAIFASSDSVATLQMLDQEATPLLYSLVFGEGVVNDATCIVLLRAIQGLSAAPEQLTLDAVWQLLSNFSQLFVLSLLLGVAVGLLSAWLIKHYFIRHSTDREVCLVALMGFMAHLLAESLGLSGIFAVFFCGITMSHYTWHSLSPSAKVVTVYLFRIISFLTELFLFIYAGFGMWSSSLWRHSIYSKGVILGKAGLLALSLLVLVFASRGGVLLVLVPLANAWRPRRQRINFSTGAVIWWAGSARGAVTVALAYHRFASGKEAKVIEWEMEDQMLVVASMAVVVFTTVVLGAVTGPLLDCMLGEQGDPEADLATLTSAWSVVEDGARMPLLGRGQRYLQKLGHWNRRSYIHDLWHRLDCGFLQPTFGGRKAKPDGYHSPPPSPARETMYAVIGPRVLERFSQVPQECNCEQQEEEETAEVAPSNALGEVATEEALGRLSPGPSGVQHALGGRRRSASMEGPFTRDASQLLSLAMEEAAQEQQWAGDEEAAYLAAGAPTEPLGPGVGEGRREQASRGRQGRKSARRLIGQGSMEQQPLWPSPFDMPAAPEDDLGGRG